MLFHSTGSVSARVSIDATQLHFKFRLKNIRASSTLSSPTFALVSVIPPPPMSTSRPILAQHNRGHSSARQAGHPYRNGSPATSVSAASSHSRVSSASSVAEMMVASNSRASPNLSNASESAVALWVDQVAARLGLNHDDTSLVHDFAIVSETNVHPHIAQLTKLTFRYPWTRS